VIGPVATAVRDWAHLYNNSTAVSSAVTYVHLAGLLVGGGFAIVADRDAFRSPPARDDFAHVHKWVVAGLAVMFASGILMMLADLNTYLTSPVFWVKMGLIALLLGNGYARIRAEKAAGPWLRRTSAVSVVLWLAVLLASTIMNTT
jgi:hypothetical protein